MSVLWSQLCTIEERRLSVEQVTQPHGDKPGAWDMSSCQGSQCYTKARCCIGCLSGSFFSKPLTGITWKKDGLQLENEIRRVFILSTASSPFFHASRLST
ncbi:hypothetical protein HYQ46_009037 [Verticillium longisporum]|nr:hypothetical protein HYQ46_009037 [Verticillium longisporum]